MGRHHLDMVKHAGMSPQAVAEIDPKRLESAKADFPDIETYGAVAEMLKKSNVSLVTIVTPHNTHEALALKCLKAGRHVISEKPMAITTSACDSMIAAAEKNDVILSAFHNRHWDGCILHALKTIRKGAIGDVVRIHCRMGGYGKPGDTWRGSRARSGGILFDWGVHLLEYGLQILNGGLVEVTGFASLGHWASRTKWKEDTNEDEGFAVVRLDSGQWLTLCISTIDANAPDHWLEITGTKGTYTFNHDTYELIRQKGRKLVRTHGANPQNEWWRYYGNIADHLTRGTDLVITPEWSRRPIHILDLAVRSAKTGKSLRAKYA
jgi:predicted dehydrogenase